jgi:hypothetical protein
VAPVSGTVLVELPGSSGRSTPWGPLAAASLTKGTGFIPLQEARQVPIGSILDTVAGTASITTAGATAKSKLLTGDFTAGIFALLQNRKQKGLTQLNLMDTLSSKKVCASVGKSKGKGTPRELLLAKKLSTKQLGLLKGAASGEFQTKGKYSAATVRGTNWSVSDQCDGTLTKVTRGLVLVRDFKTRKNILLSSGHSFLAKAPAHAQRVSIGKGKPHR